MPEIPAAIEDCSTEERIATLLYLGWTHEEIAAATNVSKGTIQNRRRQVTGGNLHLPPEAFDLILTHEREIHRLARDSERSSDTLGTEMADRMKAIADLDVLNIGPDNAISYEELVAFAVLIAGQVAEFTPQEVVRRLAPVAILVDYPPDLSKSVVDSSKLPQAEVSELNEGVSAENLLGDDDDLTQVQPSVNNDPKKLISSSKDTIDKQSRFSQKSKKYNHDFPRNEAPILRSTDREECWRRGRIYNEETGACWLGSSTSWRRSH